jgi:hypothetical protein
VRVISLGDDKENARTTDPVSWTRKPKDSTSEPDHAVGDFLRVGRGQLDDGKLA